MPPLQYSIASDTASASIGSSWQIGTSGDILYTPPAPDADFDPTDYGSSAETQALVEVLLSHELYLRRQPPLTLAPPFPFYGPQIRTYTEEELESLLE